MSNKNAFMNLGSPRKDLKFHAVSVAGQRKDDPWIRGAEVNGFIFRQPFQKQPRFPISKEFCMERDICVKKTFLFEQKSL